MRITKDQAAENRERVIDEAAKLFRQRGFDAVGVAELMRAAGLTHGGFYNHFPSKDAREAAACERIFSRSIANLEAIAEVAEPATRRRAFSSYAENYVSAENRDALAPRCPMIAFAGDVPRQSAEVRDAYAEGLRAYLDALARASDQSDPAGRQHALQQYAQWVGALTLARSVAASDPELSDEILRAARVQVSAIADTSRP
jgi:TetR/AcrR family transcriptional repressor of nem operon